MTKNLFTLLLLLVNTITYAGGKDNFDYSLIQEELPGDFPEITINTIGSPAPGYIFMENLGAGNLVPTYIMVLDGQGRPVYYYKPFLAGIDFKMQPNGLFSYCIPVKIGDEVPIGPLKAQNVMVKHLVLDTAYKQIDEVQMKNGYMADFHEFVMLPNGNFLMNAYEYIDMDMSRIVPGGDPNAIVVGTVIQELDKEKNCVFQWRSLDCLPVTESQDNLQNSVIVHVHGNSIFPDNDGNIIVSLPSAFELIKINMITGETIWRFGGPESDFEISGEHDENKPGYFSMQHDAKRLPNGNILLYDNGPAKDPTYSRAVEYSLDETAKKAQMVWEYRHTPDISAFAMGSVQRLANGNTLINWGLITGDEYKTLTEVTPEGKTEFELTLPEKMYSYRAFKYELPACRPVADVTLTGLDRGTPYTFDEGAEKTGVTLMFTNYELSGNMAVNVKKIGCSPSNPEFKGEPPVLLPGRYEFSASDMGSFTGTISFDLNELPRHYDATALKVFYRMAPGAGPYAELNTTAGTESNSLRCAIESTGEFVIGFHRPAAYLPPPFPVSPANEAWFQNGKSPALVWSPAGRYENFQVQVSDSPVFSDILKDSANLAVTKWQTTNYEHNKTYYWRARTFYRDLVSDWSETKQFSFREKFIEIGYPKGGEILGKDTNGYVLRWQTNVPDSFSVSLLKNGSAEAIIADTLKTLTNAAFWRIPEEVPEGTDYKIRVQSLKDNKTMAESAGYFEIRDRITDIADEAANSVSVTIEVMPNPSAEITAIRLNVAKSCYVSLKLYSAEGAQAADLLNTEIPGGSYSLHYNTGSLAAGVYYLKMYNGRETVTTKLIIAK